MTDQTCQKRFSKFFARALSLVDAPRSGRPVEADRDQIETLIENNHCSTTWETANSTQNILINKVIDENEKCVFHSNGLSGHSDIILH